MKKLILNRFLLNPKLFVELYRPTKDLLQAYVLAANRIRVLYYEEKAQTLQTQ